jgi:hypothetical protein
VKELLETDPSFEEIMDNEHVPDEFKKGNDQLTK